MAAPATRESKPGSGTRDAGDGQAHNARRVTGPLAGAVLGPTVCGGWERGRWRRTTPTTGLFQRDGGWFGPGDGVFTAEEGLIEGIDAGREPSVQGVDAIVQGVDPGSVRTLPGQSPQEEKGAVDRSPAQSDQARRWEVKARCQRPVEDKEAGTRVKVRVGGRVKGSGLVSGKVR